MADSTSRDLTQTTLRVLFIGILIAASFWIARPFLPATIWATMIVIATWPAMIRLQGMLGGKRGRAVAVMTLVLLLVFVIPFSMAAITVFENSGSAFTWLQTIQTQPLPQPPQWMEGLPVVGSKAVLAWREAIAGGPESLVARVAPYLGSIFAWFVGTLGSLGMLVIQFVVTVLICAILYANGEHAARGVRLFGLRLGGEQGEHSIILAAQAIRGIAMGVVVTALLQTAAAGAGLAVAGVPAAALLTVLTFVLCIAQIGPGLVLLCASAWLYWSGSHAAGILLFIYTLPVGAMDSFIRPILIRRGVDLPLMLIMSGVIGGLMAFGIVGIFIGPVVLAVAYTLLTDWVNEGGEAQH
ncbi:MAG: AI-2E family transporter YdiK [Bryobacterales bacterium]|nr:AI-2E family transporter YdiK [Bryobacterales bacterium]